MDEVLLGLCEIVLRESETRTDLHRPDSRRIERKRNKKNRPSPTRFTSNWEKEKQEQTFTNLIHVELRDKETKTDLHWPDSRRIKRKRIKKNRPSPTRFTSNWETTKQVEQTFTDQIHVESLCSFLYLLISFIADRQQIAQFHMAK